MFFHPFQRLRSLVQSVLYWKARCVIHHLILQTLRKPQIGGQFWMPILVKSFSHSINRGDRVVGTWKCWKQSRISEDRNQEVKIFIPDSSHCGSHGDEALRLHNNLINARETIYIFFSRTCQRWCLMWGGKKVTPKRTLSKTNLFIKKFIQEKLSPVNNPIRHDRLCFSSLIITHTCVYILYTEARIILQWFGL